MLLLKAILKTGIYVIIIIVVIAIYSAICLFTVPGILLYDIIIFLRALLTNFFSHAGPSENVACGFNSTSMQKKRDEGDVYYYRDTLHTKVHDPEVVAHV